MSGRVDLPLSIDAIVLSQLSFKHDSDRDCSRNSQKICLASKATFAVVLRVTEPLDVSIWSAWIFRLNGADGGLRRSGS